MKEGQVGTRRLRVPRTRSPRRRFVFAISALVALVLAANSLVLALAGRPHLREDLERRAEAYAQLSAGPICKAYETYYASGYSKFRELLLDIMRLEPDLSRLAIYDTAGHLLFDSRELASQLFEPARGSPRAASGGALQRAVKGMALSAWTSPEGGDRGGGSGGGKPVYVVAAPFVEEWGRHRYSVVFYIAYDSLRAAAMASAWRILWLSAGSLALGVAIAILLAAQSVEPLETLTRGAQDIAARATC
ncbi:MAG TPA: hypothetical protein VHQ90_23545 [Thermoanaerobaculia bacterium]|nr:hypothetical protein [Thermoanaerobaculia bacterium]